MSETYLKIIPKKIGYVPDESTYEEAVAFVEELTPDGEEVEIEVFEHLSFIDQGEYLDEIICPSCSKSLEQDIYSEAETECSNVFEQIMEQSGNSELETGVIEMPCCGSKVKTTDITFESTAGFAKFELSAHNPEIDAPVSESDINGLSKILGCELLQIWARY